MTPLGGAEAAPPTRTGVGIGAWSLYDFGYSLFAFVLFARYLSDWIIIDLGRPDYYYTTAQAAVAVLLLVLMPISGVVTDIIGRHKPVLGAYTLIAVVAGGIIGVMDPDIGSLGIVPVLAMGVVSAAATALAFSQFDPLLAVVAPRRTWGVVSGVAVAAGYVGILAWLLGLARIVVGEGDKQQAFIPAAGIFLALSIPLFVFVREPRHGDAATTERAKRDGVVRTSLTQTAHALRRLRTEKEILRLLLGRLLYADAVGTVQVYAVVYVSRVGDFSEQQKDLVIALVVLFAGIGALGAGWLAGRKGPRYTLLHVVPAFAIGLVVVAGFGQPWTVWLLAPVVGVSLGTIYAVDRVFMLALTPPALRGELFGFFNLIGRVGQSIGPFLLWGGVIWVLHDLTGWLSALGASRVSIVLLGLSSLIGLRIIAPLDDRHAETASADD